MTKVVFLDRDGTINVDNGYVHRKEDFVLLPGTIEALSILQNLGYLLVIVTNQSGIGRGYFSEEEYASFEKEINKILSQQGIEISAFYHCPHIDSDYCECRKPKLGMFYQAAERFDIDWAKSYAIGDKPRDLCVCKSTSTKGILIENARTYEDGTDPSTIIFPKVSSLFEAAKLISKEDMSISD